MVTDDWYSDWKMIGYPDHDMNGKTVRQGKSELTKLKDLL